ncbi:DEAD/DEAH box helicase [Pigmentiphaga aceris]|uniref:DEAD-box ATP-dependent RNA helicase RhpA n=1 Tax=Pigmentiphaga aceris TaxID=1940612 RepID=A0A5C0B6I0_9BURK|nr:DEAD/DEAH box helicase [Pigmentiphaga aceris]QEI09050.1 DEAD/DEAH box helicase [Pigmentiphaga aceris]
MRAIAEAGYTQPTPIQSQAIPQVLKGGDLLAAAQTGTGKTAGFTLPILQLLSEKPLALQKPGRPRCLIMTPTRELTAQVEESVQTYGKYLKLKSMVMFGGVNINPQINALRKNVDILVATPGRLLDHVGQKTLDLSGVEILVLDEADRMLDMGFIRDIRKVLALLPKQRQTLLYSATFSDEIRTLAKTVLNNPGEVSVARRNTTTELVQQTVYMVHKDQKRDLLAHLIRTHEWHQVLVFTRTKHGANRLAEKLQKDGISAAAIHGNKSQAARTKALAGFKENTVRVLVATDIAARGLDIDQLPQVVNFELPNVPEDYVHRIGRTGRAGSSGAAVSLVEGEEVKLLKGIEKLIKRQIEQVPLPAFTVRPKTAEDSDERPPRQPRGPGRGGNAGGGNAGRSAPRGDAPRSAGSGRGDASRGGRNDGRNDGRGARDGAPASRGNSGNGGRGNASGEGHGRSGNPARSANTSSRGAEPRGGIAGRPEQRAALFSLKSQG